MLPYARRPLVQLFAGLCVLRGSVQASYVSLRTLPSFLHRSPGWTTVTAAGSTTTTRPQTRIWVSSHHSHSEPPPPTWEQLQDMVHTGRLDQLRRTRYHQQRYDRHKRQVLEEYRTIYDFLRYDKFGLDRVREADGRYRVPAPPPGTVRLALADNTFPYQVGEDVRHWVLWKLGGTIDDDEVRHAQQELRTQIPQVRSVLHWRNPPHLQSLPELDHVHILVRSWP